MTLSRPAPLAPRPGSRGSSRLPASLGGTSPPPARSGCMERQAPPAAPPARRRAAGAPLPTCPSRRPLPPPAAAPARAAAPADNIFAPYVCESGGAIPPGYFFCPGYMGSWSPGSILRAYGWSTIAQRAANCSADPQCYAFDTGFYLRWAAARGRPHRMERGRAAAGGAGGRRAARPGGGGG